MRGCIALAWLACLLVPGAGCRSTPAQAPSRPIEPRTDTPAPGATITLYRDGAVIRDRRRLAVAAGTSTIELDAVAHSLIGASPTLVSLSEPAGLHVRAWLAPVRARAPWVTALINRQVTVQGSNTPGGSVTGVLKEVEQPASPGPADFPAAAVIDTRAPELRRVAPVYWIEGPAETWSRPAPGRLAWTVEAARAATHLVEVTYATDALSWRVRYQLLLDDHQSPAPRSRLRGWIELENQTGVALEGAQVRVWDHPLEQSVQAGRLDVPSLPAAALAAPVHLAPGARTSRLFVDVVGPAVEEVLTYEPINPGLNHEQARPRWTRSYGTRANTAVYRSLRLLLRGRDQAGGLPAGELVMLRRDPAGVARVVGQGWLAPAFMHAGAALMEVRLDIAAEVHGQRQQREYSYDPQARRLVEEIGITLYNRGERPVTVVIREYLYRSLNWAIGYHNGIGDPRKDGPQQVRFTVPVAAGEQAFVLYRVVYTW